MLPAPEKAKPTVRAVAAELGVSAMTVTRAMNGHPGVSAETRQRVLEKIKELGYDIKSQSNTQRAIRSQQVAVHCSDAKLQKNNFINFHIRLYYLVIRRLKAQQLTGHLVDLNGDAAAFRPVLDDCGGLILLGPVTPGVLEEIRQRQPGLKIVSVLGDTEEVARVDPDDYAGGVLAAQRMAECFHRHIGVLANLADASFRDRYRGFCGEMLRLQPDCRIDLLEYRDRGEQRLDDEARQRVLEEYFTNRATLASAFFSPSGYDTVYLADDLARRGYRIPDDFSLLAYDNLDLLARHTPPFDRIGFDLKLLAAQAVLVWQGLPEEARYQRFRLTIPNQYLAGGTLRKR